MYAGAEEISDAAARLVVDTARETMAARKRFVLLLSGGTSPRRTYGLLASRYAGDVPWPHCDVFFSDERCVPPADPRNNFRLAHDLLLSKVPVPDGQVHAIPSVGVPLELAGRYDAMLRARFPPTGPTFDLAIMGMGPDGHTASLFPGDAALHETHLWAVAVKAPAGMEVENRITLTLPILNRSRVVLYIVPGQGKQEALRRVRGMADGAPLPASLVYGLHRTIWLLDRDAAAAPPDRPG